VEVNWASILLNKKHIASVKSINFFMGKILI
jgi:hypothetical protein